MLCDSGVAVARRACVLQSSTTNWPIGTYVTGTVCWSLYCFLKSPDDYWETIFSAVRALCEPRTCSSSADGSRACCDAPCACACAGLHVPRRWNRITWACRSRWEVTLTQLPPLPVPWAGHTTACARSRRTYARRGGGITVFDLQPPVTCGLTLMSMTSWLDARDWVECTLFGGTGPLPHNP